MNQPYGQSQKMWTDFNMDLWHSVYKAEVITIFKPTSVVTEHGVIMFGGDPVN